MNSGKVKQPTVKEKSQENLFNMANTTNPSNISLMKDIDLSESIIPFALFRKISNLYATTLDARKVLLKYKANLSMTSIECGCEYNCITPLSASEKIPMLFYKREDLTSIKAYKVRGALYQMSKIIETNPSSDVKFIAASTGNHALGVLKAAEILKVSNITICISKSVTNFKQHKLEKRIFDLKKQGINAQLMIEGDTFDQTNEFAHNLLKSAENSFYIDPYNTHNAVAGQGTIGLELLSQLDNKLSNIDTLKEITVIVPIGGGGLISGISCALKSDIENFPALKNLNLRILGVCLEDLNSKYGDAIKVEKVGEHNDEYISYFVEEQVCINDKDMESGINFVYEDLGVQVEGASAGTLKPVLENIVVPSETNAVVCILSGGNK